MSPELERLLWALWDRDTAEPGERTRFTRQYDALIEAVLAKHPHLHCEQLEAALRVRYREFLRARRRPPTLPPSA